MLCRKKLKILAFLLVISLFCNLTMISNAQSELNAKSIQYYSVVLGVPEEEVIRLYNESVGEFNNTVESTFAGRLYTDNMYNLENNIDVSKVTLNKSISECAELFGISEDTVEKHLGLCSINVYNKIIKTYCNLYLSEDSKTVGTYSEPGGMVGSLDPVLWKRMVDYAHTGNIFITKDSYSYGYRHGHVGVVQSHIYEDKFIVEATEADRPADEVIRQKLKSSWGNKVSLCMVYPNTNTVGDRERAGNQTAFYAEGALYTYKFNNTKPEAKNSDSRKLNCVGVAVRAYHFMANYDIVPQVNNIEVLLPSYIYYSPNIRFKYYSDGSLLRTPGFEEIEWGFGWN